jgi:hypothetical protein
MRAEFMLHELFHRIQTKLGLMTQVGRNEHLDTVDGRVWLQLEWRALAQALRLSGDDRIRAIRDAVAFRLERRKLFAGADENERLDEIRGGLAQYTGTVLSATSDAEAKASAVEQLAGAEKQETFVQTFAYTSGAAYGLLLDMSSHGWRRRVNIKSDLGQMLMVALDIQSAENATESALRYGGTELRAAEEKRNEQRKALVRQLRERFVEGPLLLLPAGGGGTFDMRGATPVPGSGTVYFSNYRLKGAWGSLDATKGVLLCPDGTRKVSGPIRIDGDTITGDGWRVTITSGWVVRAGPRAGDYQLVREDR